MLYECINCGKKPLKKDEIGACKKLIHLDTTTFFCLECFCDYLGCSMEDLKEMIQKFKDDGCKLF